MTSDEDARVWLRANGHSEIADSIDSIMGSWRDKGLRTRRNWWDILAGSPDGKGRSVAGITFPVLAAARRRKKWPEVETEIRAHDAEVAPSPSPQARWKNAPLEYAAEVEVVASNEPLAAIEAPVKKTKRTLKNSTSADVRGTVKQLLIERFAQIEHVEVPLTDLLVLIGPQATGKSLVLEMLKLAIDRNRVVRSLKQHGFNWDQPSDFAALYFGGGFDSSWNDSTNIKLGNENITLIDVSRSRAKKGEDAVFYIPAHRTLAIADGWPLSFAQYKPETPYVARRFSEELLTSLNKGLVGKGKIFPHDRRLKDAFRKLIDDAIFHGANLKLDTKGMRKQFVLEYEKSGATLPFMAWTAGQREFTPMLLGLYHLLPPGGTPKKKEIHWAIIEEPEMGLHPKAIVAVMAVVLDLLARGYKVALSTHSPTVLEVVWGMSRLKDVSDGPARLCEMMGLPGTDRNVLKTATAALKKSSSVVYLVHSDDGRVHSKDISALDSNSDDKDEWNWGGITGFSATVADIVSRARSTH